MGTVCGIVFVEVDLVGVVVCEEEKEKQSRTSPSFCRRTKKKKRRKGYVSRGRNLEQVGTGVVRRTDRDGAVITNGLKIKLMLCQQARAQDLEAVAPKNH